jgi:hypothetical protein
MHAWACGGWECVESVGADWAAICLDPPLDAAARISDGNGINERVDRPSNTPERQLSDACSALASSRKFKSLNEPSAIKTNYCDCES